MNDLDTLVAAIQSGAVPLAVGLALVLVVRLGRHPLLAPQWERIPAAYRPLVPVALGLLGSVGDALVSGRTWLPAVLYGLASALPAVLLALPSPVVPGKTVVVEEQPRRLMITRRD